MFKLIKNYESGLVEGVLRIPDNAAIPFNQANTDYQAYLAWLAESPNNKPLPADN